MIQDLRALQDKHVFLMIPNALLILHCMLGSVVFCLFVYSPWIRSYLRYVALSTDGKSVRGEAMHTAHSKPLPLSCL